MRLRETVAFEAVSSDLMPTCPRCGELSAAGAVFCGSCNGPLTERVAYARRIENLKPFYCANCCRHFPDNACDVCGADLSPLRSETTDSASPSNPRTSRSPFTTEINGPLPLLHLSGRAAEARRSTS